MDDKKDSLVQYDRLSKKAQRMSSDIEINGCADKGDGESGCDGLSFARVGIHLHGGCYYLAEGPGFEPGLTGPEPVVLPLDDPSI